MTIMTIIISCHDHMKASPRNYMQTLAIEGAGQVYVHTLDQ